MNKDKNVVGRKKVVVSVTNDLFSDQRVDKVCNSLTAMGFEVTLVGRCYASSPALLPRNYHTRRMRLWFKKKAIFYVEFQIRLFFLLLFSRMNILVSNDLDTLLPNFIISKIRNKKLVYDSHEYFCGVPELIHRPKIQAVWRFVERLCVPYVSDMITVNQSIADLYDKEYPQRKNRVRVVRNFPVLTKPSITETKRTLNISEDKMILLLQGSGINVDRGGEELVAAMSLLDPQRVHLLIVGSGDAIPNLKKEVSERNLENVVTFVARTTPQKLANYTYWADIGFSLDKDTNLNYRYSLPNKIFDYIRAETPVICSDLPEIAKIIRESQTGIVLDEMTPKAIASAVNILLEEPEKYRFYKENCTQAAICYCWENEEGVLKEVYRKV
jgi:glycosyltransferase involved in cell wall biosynthesis